MLRSIELKNFKSWRELPEIELGRVTALFGVNSAGKSSIIQSLLLMKQTAESPDRREVLKLGGERSYVDLGTFTDLIYNHNPLATVEIRFSWDPERGVPFHSPFAGMPPIRFHTAVDRLGHGELRLKEFTYAMGSGHLTLFAEPDGTYGVRVMDNAIQRSREFAAPGQARPVKCYGVSPEIPEMFVQAESVGDLQTQFEELFGKVFYLGPLRERGSRQYAWSGISPSDMGPRGERAVDALVAARKRAGAPVTGDSLPGSSLEREVASALKRLGLIGSFRLDELDREGNLYRVLVKGVGAEAEVALSDVGFGIAQVLPVITMLYHVQPGSAVLLEHPEIHLHPSVQASLADVVIDAAKARGIQVIVESHSEHFLRRIQRRVAEQWEGLSDEDVRLYFVGTSGSESKIEPLRLDAYGNITNWPEGFFGDPLEDMVAKEEAALKRIREQRAG